MRNSASQAWQMQPAGTITSLIQRFETMLGRHLIGMMLSQVDICISRDINARLPRICSVASEEGLFDVSQICDTDLCMLHHSVGP